MSALRVPGDKSIAHRALLLAALASGTSRLRGMPDGLDVASTRRALETLGIAIADDGASVLVTGGAGNFTAPGRPIDCGNSGSTIRMLAGILATRDITATLDGDASLRARPMLRITEPLSAFGARFASALRGTAPIVVSGNPAARGVDAVVALPSAQVKSALLLAALGAHGTTRLTGQLATRDHTERMLAGFGVSVVAANGGLQVEGPAALRACDVDVPGDISSAAFLLAAAAATPGARVVVEDVGLNPTRTAFLGVLRRFGAEVRAEVTSDGVEPRGRITVRGATLAAIDIEPHEVPSLIDELPLVGVLGAFARGTTTVRGAAELRVKESDRIEHFADAARALGAEVQTAPDGFAVRGPARMHDAQIVTGGDHRIAMAFSVAARVAGVVATLDDPDCVAVSFPGFAAALEQVG